MKKLFIGSLAALSLLATSCGDSEISDVKLETAEDSLSYAIGVLVSQQISSQEGVKEAINPAVFSAAMKDVLKGDSSEAFTVEDASKIYGDFMQKMAEKKKDVGTAFLEENKSKEGVQVTASGLQYKVLTEGTGVVPASTDQVRVHYHGTLIDGTVFDSSVDRGEPATFGVTQVIPGWVEALQLMPVGSKWKLFIPSDLAYGPRGAGQMIPPHSALVFEVELLEIVTPEAEAAE